MEVLDDEGRLFGVVNVVDALVVLLVVAVALAGAALVFDGPAPTDETDTRYVTLDAGDQPDFVVEQINEGDRSRVGRYNLTVTDVYLAPGDDATRTVLKIEVTGPTTDGQFRLDGAPLRLGRDILFGTPTYNLTGTVTNVGSEATLQTGRTPVVIQGAVASDVATDIDPGDEATVGGRTTIVVEDVAVFETDDPNRRVVSLAATLSTYDADGAERFGGTRLQSGQTVSLPLDGRTFSGEIRRVGGGLDRTTRNILVTDVVDTEAAAQIATGDTYRVAGEPVATVERVSVYGTDDPNQKRVYVGLALETLGYADQPVFGDTFLQTGATVPFRTSAYDLSGEITRVGALEQRGTETTATVTLRMEGVRPERADDIHSGMTEVGGGETVARLVDIQTEPATVVLTSDDGQIFAREHPVLKDLTVTAEFTVRETATGTLFKGRRLQVGGDVTLALGSTTVRATVVSVDT